MTARLTRWALTTYARRWSRNSQSPVGSRQSAIGSRQSAVGIDSPQSAVGSQQSAANSRRLRLNDRKTARLQDGAKRQTFRLQTSYGAPLSGRPSDNKPALEWQEGHKVSVMNYIRLCGSLDKITFMSVGSNNVAHFRWHPALLSKAYA